MVRSSIDLGTNTCLLLVADWDSPRKEVGKVVGDFSTVVRLGQGVDQAKSLHPEAIQRTLSCLETYAQKLKLLGLSPRDTRCVATSQARDAQNGVEFFLEVEKKTGFKFQIISGADEAKFTFLGGLLPGQSPKDSAVIDIGGGSTEIIASVGGKSLDIGSVRFTERFLRSDPVTDEEFWRAQAEVDAQLLTLKSWRAELPADTQLVAVAGTATTLASWYLGLAQFDANALDQVTLTRGDIHRMVEELKWRTIDERKKLTGIEAGRADVLLAGSLILWRALELLDFPRAQISTRGLRYGVLTDEFVKS